MKQRFSLYLLALCLLLTACGGKKSPDFSVLEEKTDGMEP